MSTDKDLLQEWFDGDRATVQEAMARRCAEDPALAERVLAHDHCVAMLQGRLTSSATDPVIILDRLRRRRWHGRLRRTGLVLAAAAILAAIAAWWPKLRPGGMLIGHDYNPERFPGVCRAADEFAQQTQQSINRRAHTVWSIQK